MPKNLGRNEWYFEECPTDEADECCLYEYARESNAQKEIIAQWRGGAKGNSVEDYFERSDFVFDPPPNTGTYAYFPSWPDKPFLSVPRKTRTLWYEALEILADKQALFDPAIEVASWDEKSSRALLENFEETGQVSCKYRGDQYVVFKIPWDQNDQRLTRKFQSWLKKNRPEGAKPLEMRGRGNPARPWRLALKQLSCYRLLQAMSIEDAIAFLKDAKLKLRPYEHTQDWKTAVKKAKDLIERFEKPAPKEIISERFRQAFDEEFPEDFLDI